MLGRHRDLVGQGQGALGGRADLVQVVLDGLWVGGLLGGQLAVVDGHGEQVAELVHQLARREGALGLAGSVHSRFTRRHLLISPSRSYPSSSSTWRAMARPRPVSLVGSGMPRVR